MIGAGVVGLAVAARLAVRGARVVVLERRSRPLTETSSRNSGVVHAGLYYPEGSLKAETCVEGRELLYARCRAYGVPHRRLGKVVVATSPAQVPSLERLAERGRRNGAGALRLLDGVEVERLAPGVRAVAGLWSPASGIVDVHALAGTHRAEAQAHGALFALRTPVCGLERQPSGWAVRTGGAAPYTLRAEAVVNAAGLAADRIAELAGLDVDALGWRLRPCKGDYFTVAPGAGAPRDRLVYPMPEGAGLGVHLTPDLGGQVRAGPDATYVEAPRYDVDPAKAHRFAEAVRAYLPGVRAEHLHPGYAGVRPRLQGPGEPFRDFVLEERPAGLVHLLGIESPGLTAAEALARRVARLLRP